MNVILFSVPLQIGAGREEVEGGPAGQSSGGERPSGTRSTVSWPRSSRKRHAWSSVKRTMSLFKPGRWILNTVEPRYKEVGYNKILLKSNKVILLVPALYSSLFLYPDIMRNLI